MDEFLKLTGHLNIKRWNAAGELVQEVDQPNIVTTVGKTMVAKLIANEAVTRVTHLQVGSGTAAPSVNDTTLQTPLTSAIKAFSAGPTRSGLSITYEAQFLAGEATGTITEGGMFNAASAGDMMCRSLFAASIPKGASDIVTVTWTVVVG